MKKEQAKCFVIKKCFIKIPYTCFVYEHKSCPDALPDRFIYTYS